MNADMAVKITVKLNYGLIAVSGWLLLNMTVHGIRVYAKKPCCTGSRLFSLCYLGVLLNLARLVLTIVMANLGTVNAVDHCERMRRAANSLSAMNLVFIYGLLWFRQKLFHSDKLLKGESYNRYVSILSWLTLIMLLSSPIIILWIAGFSDNVGHDTEDCVYLIEREKWLVVASWAVFILTIVIQSCLLFLLIFPLVYMRMKSRIFIHKSGRKDKLLLTIRRCIICGVVAVITDITFLLLLGFLPRPPGYPVIVGDTMANINLVINDFCVIATFNKAPRILTGAFYKLRMRSRAKQAASTAWDLRTSTNDLWKDCGLSSSTDFTD